MTVDELHQMILAIGRAQIDPVAARDKALLLVGFAGAFRRSELVELQRGDVEIDEECMIITLGHSKTDQIGAGTEKLIERQKKHCPVAALEHWLSAAGIRNKDAASPVFRAINQWGHVSKTALSSRGVVQILQRAAELAGFAADTFSGHSLRAGFVTDQLAKDIGEIKIMQMTGHKSVNTLRKYYRPNRRRARVLAT